MRPMTWGEVWSALYQIRTQGPSDLTTGICWNFECVTARTARRGDWEELNDMAAMGFVFERMGLDRHYPVAHPTMTNEDAYNHARDDIWDKDTDYGKNRWALLDKMLEFTYSQPQDEPLAHD